MVPHTGQSKKPKVEPKEEVDVKKEEKPAYESKDKSEGGPPTKPNPRPGGDVMETDIES